MNRKQKILTVLALCLFGLSVCCAPWEKIAMMDGRIFQRETIYSPVWLPPASWSAYTVDEFRLRWSSVLLTWAALGLGYGTVLAVLKQKSAA